LLIVPTLLRNIEKGEILLMLTQKLGAYCAMLFGAKLRVAGDNIERFAARQFYRLAVAQQIGEGKFGNAGLPRAEKIAWAAQFQIHFRNAKAVVGFLHRFEPDNAGFTLARGVIGFA
jgi:hypothetical protein